VDFGRGGHDGCLVRGDVSRDGPLRLGEHADDPELPSIRYPRRGRRVPAVRLRPAVQLSVFECQVCSQTELQSLRA